MRSPIRNQRLLREVFARDPIRYAYQIGDLDQRYFDLCEFYLEPETAAATATALHFQTGPFVSLVLTGHRDAIERLLATMRLPGECRLQFELEQAAVVARYYAVRGEQAMLRMGLARSAFVPVPPRKETRELDLRDRRALHALYSGWDPTTADFHDRMLQAGTNVYLGLWAGGRLVAVAATHFVAPEYELAALGGVFTDAAYRNRGLSTLVCSELCERLLTQVSEVALNVAAGNAPALAVYHKLGFREHHTFIEATGLRLRS